MHRPLSYKPRLADGGQPVCSRFDGWFGATRRGRTSDARVFNTALYQLSYCGNFLGMWALSKPTVLTVFSV